MMMAAHTRPSRTDELVERLVSIDCTAQETQALQALCRSMVEVFHDAPRLSYVAEAAAISAVLRHNVDDIDTLVIAFSNIIISGTSDASIKETDILNAFAFVLRHTKELPYIRSRLGPVLQSLTTRLKAARNQADIDAQYHLTVCLSKVLDAMADIKFGGISRESLHEPLAQQLQALSEEREPRLAQAAAYALQALRGVSDDEGPWEALLRYTNQGISVAANTAGAVAKADPSQLYATIPDVVSLAKGLQRLFENVTEIAEAIFADREWIDSLNKFKKPKMWYHALRYTDLFLQCKAWERFKDIITNVDCREDKHFLSGIFSLLESTWIEADRVESISHKEKIVDLLKWTVATTRSRDPLVQAWVSITADTTGLSLAMSLSEPSGFKRWTTKKFESKVHIFHQHTITRNSSMDKLLGEAWQRCFEAKLFYADAAIQYYYTQSNRLEIERLSGERLPLDKCFINLALAGGPIDEKHPLFPQPTQSTKVHATDDDENSSRVSLSHLFDVRRSSNGNSFQPRRIFIQGRAGIGKTTLCKKIVHEFVRGRFARDLFDHIIWISLRKLKAKTETYTLEALLHDEYFSHAAEGQILTETIKKLVDDTNLSKRVLFLLDGLDEVSQKWDRDTSPYELLQRLLLMPSVIVTSRPQVAAFDLGKFDLELETIGFRLTEVEDYMKHCINDKSKLTMATRYLEVRPVLRNITRIPIQLDALCYIWTVDDLSTAELSTVTNIYQLVTEQLWKKDIVRTSKQHEGLQLTQRQAQNLKGFQIAEYMKVETELLEEFAFHGLRAQIVEFTPQHCDAIVSELYRRNVPIPTLYSDTLEKLSFLRTSATVPEGDAQSYHFLHLTFQEFFAAKYFARHWLQGKYVFKLDLKASRPSVPPEQMNLADMVHEQKYNPRYRVFWRFVVGLLQASSVHIEDSQRFVDFWNEIEGEPIDLFGTIHHKLLTAASSELAYSNLPVIESLHPRIDAKLYDWALRQAKMSSYDSIIEDPEFPARVLGILAKDADYELRARAIQLLSQRTYVEPSTIQLFFENMTDDSMQEENIAIIALRARQYELSKADLHILLCQTDHLLARDALLTQMDLYESASATLMEVLNNTDDSGMVRIIAARMLQVHGKLSKDGITIVFDLLEKESLDVRERAVEVLAQQPHISLEVLEAVFRCLEEVYNTYRYPRVLLKKMEPILDRPELFSAIITILCPFELSLQYSIASRLFDNCELLPQDVWGSLLDLLQDETWKLRVIACKIISLRGDAPLAAFTGLVALLQDNNSLIRVEAVKSLVHHATQLPQQTFVALTELLRNVKPHIRKAALSVLLPESRNFTPNMLHMLHKCLRSTDREERLLALQVVSNRSSFPLPSDICYTIAAMVNSEDSNTFNTLLQILPHDKELPSVVLQALVKQWTDGGRNAEAAVARVMKAQYRLPRDILDLLFFLLKAGGKSVQRTSCEILSRQPDLILSMKDELLSQSESKDAEIQALSILLLGFQSHVSPNITQNLVELMEKEDAWTVDTAAESLMQRPSLPQEVLVQMARILQSLDSFRRLAAHRVLLTNKALPIQVIHILIEISSSLEPEPQSKDKLEKYKRDRTPHSLVREILLAQSVLSDMVISHLITFIDHKDYTTRTLVLRAIASQSNLPPLVVEAITDFLNKANFRECIYVLSIFLLRNPGLHEIFSGLNDRAVVTACYILFNSAACYMHNGVLWVHYANKCQKLNASSGRLQAVMRVIQGAKNRQTTLAVAQAMKVPTYLPLEGYDDPSKPLVLGHS